MSGKKELECFSLMTFGRIITNTTNLRLFFKSFTRSTVHGGGLSRLRSNHVTGIQRELHTAHTK